MAHPVHKGAFEAAVGPQWAALTIGHLYQVLERLSRDGYVTSHRVGQAVKPDRVVYEITPDGRTEATRWLNEPALARPATATTSSSRYGAAQTRDPGVLPAVVSTQRGYLLRELRNLEELRDSAGMSASPAAGERRSA